MQNPWKVRGQGWAALAGEMAAEMARLWRRNLGRDDRIVADRGREARHPFLAEPLIEALLAVPLPLVVDLRLPPGEHPSLLLPLAKHKLHLIY